jgi:hypothetical protein
MVRQKHVPTQLSQQVAALQTVEHGALTSDRCSLTPEVCKRSLMVSRLSRALASMSLMAEHDVTDGPGDGIEVAFDVKRGCLAHGLSPQVD